MTVTIDNTSPCPCTSGREYGQCCAPYIVGDQLPETAALLMRSRYTAYTLANIDYIEHTTQPSMRAKYDFSNLKEWAESSEWLGLTIHTEQASSAPNLARVCFTARYRQNDLIINHSEDSEFVFEEGRWYFVHGKDYTPPSQKTVGRNDPCVCGSGKKYKKCCLK